MLNQGCKQLLVAFLMLGAAVSRAAAQEVLSDGFVTLNMAPEVIAPERQSVLQHNRPDYDPLGIRAGSCLLFPTLDAVGVYDSNVYATTNNTKSDFYADITPALSLQSDWNSNALIVQTSGEIKRYAEQVSENVSNFTGLVGGRLDVVHDVYFTAVGGYEIQHEDRNSPDALNGKFPIEYDVALGQLGYVHEAGRLGLRINGLITNYDYHNGITSSGLPVIETDRSRTEYSATGRVSYEIVPGYHGFVQASGNVRDYNSKFDAGGFQRSSTGYEVDIGTAFALGPTINGEVYVGYIDQNYDDARLKDGSGVAFGGNLLWNVTQLTSIRASVARTVEETIISPASSYLQTTVSLGVEHELLRDFLISGALTYIVQDYEGINRTDDNYGANLQMRYLLNRNLSAGVGFNYVKRSSNSVGDAVGAAYDRTSVTADIRFQY